MFSQLPPRIIYIDKLHAVFAVVVVVCSVEGKVVVTREPCLHPGDLRVLDAVACPAVSE